MTAPRVTIAALVLAASVPATALADEPPENLASVTTTTVVRRPNPEQGTNIEERLSFLEDRIATQRLHAQLWWESWVSFYGIGVVVQTARAIEATERAEQADLVVSVVKAVGGVVRYVVDPMKGIQGFDPVPGESTQARVARGERILKENAENTTAFGPWYAHLINFGINGTGAVIVGAGFDDWEQGLISAGIGFAIGEVSLLTQPWEADSDLEEYEAKYGQRKTARRAPDVKWTIIPSGGGAALRASF